MPKKIKVYVANSLIRLSSNIPGKLDHFKHGEEVPEERLNPRGIPMLLKTNRLKEMWKEIPDEVEKPKVKVAVPEAAPILDKVDEIVKPEKKEKKKKKKSFKKKGD